MQVRIAWYLSQEQNDSEELCFATTYSDQDLGPHRPRRSKLHGQADHGADVDASASRSHCSSISRGMTWLVRCACAIRDPALRRAGRRPIEEGCVPQPPRGRVFVRPGLNPNGRPPPAVWSATVNSRTSAVAFAGVPPEKFA